MRGGAPIYELALMAGGHRMEDKFWQQTLRALATHFVTDPLVAPRRVCVDRRRQWRNARNVWKSAVVSSVLHTATRPFRRRAAASV